MHLGFDFLSPAEKDAPPQRVLHVLDHVGIGVASAVALDLLEEAERASKGKVTRRTWLRNRSRAVWRRRRSA